MERTKVLTHNGRRHLPLPTGPYTVACTDIMTSYSKFGVFSRLFYPSEDQGVLERYLQWPLWVPQKEYLNGYAVRKSVPPWCVRLFYKVMVGKLHIPVVWQAPLRYSKEKYPVIVFSHGLSGWRTSYSSICSELASYGFVVAAVEHRDYSASASFYKKQIRMSSIGKYPGSSMCDLDEAMNDPIEFNSQDLVDGKWEPVRDQTVGPYCHAKEWMLYQPATDENEIAFRNKQVAYRAKECVEVLDMLEDLSHGRYVNNILDSNFNQSIFRNQIDLKNAFIVGHSFGGATAFLSLATELRFRAGVILDPYMLPFFEDQSSFSMISQPFLCLIVESFQRKSSLRLLKKLQDLNKKGEFITMKDAYHRDLCDTPFVPKFRPALSTKVGFRIERFEALDIASDLILQYIGQYLGKRFYSSSKELELLKQKYLVCEDNFSKVM